MGKLFEIPDDIVKRFFEAVITRGKYTVEHDVNDSKKFYLIRRREEEYYKPRIVINNIDELDTALRNYITNIDVFYSKYNNLEDYHDLNFFLGNLPINMSNVDAQDFVGYVNKRASMFEKDIFDNYPLNEKKAVKSIGGGYVLCVQGSGMPWFRNSILYAFLYGVWR